MNINNPGDIRRLFQAQLQKKRKQLWCVTLSLNGRILDLKCLPTSPKESLLSLNRVLKYFEDLGHSQQILIVRIDPDEWELFDFDFLLIEKLQEVENYLSFILCDYLVLWEAQEISLLEEYLTRLLVTDENLNSTEFGRSIESRLSLRSQFPFDH